MMRVWIWLCALTLLAFSPGIDQAKPAPVLPTQVQVTRFVPVPVSPLSIEPAPTLVPTHIEVEPAPTLNAAPTEIFFYSYYNPDLLAPGDIVDGMCAQQEGKLCHTVNCWDFDLLAGRCRSPMASGLDWREYTGKALACGYGYPLGTVFRVLEPAGLAGDYPCLDRCPDCTGKRLLDFVSLYQALPWQTELLVQVDP